MESSITHRSSDDVSGVISGHPVISLGAALFEAYDLRRHFQLDWTRLINCFRKMC